MGRKVKKAPDKQQARVVGTKPGFSKIQLIRQPHELTPQQKRKKLLLMANVSSVNSGSTGPVPRRSKGVRRGPDFVP